MNYILKISIFIFLTCPIFNTLQAQDIKHIDLNHIQTGRTFEGIGGVSAGASSELLFDYPEKQRNQILDFLFKPNYGASLQQLKVEIGADAVVVGAEASHARTMDELLHPKEEYYTRGYEYWLMNEARKRNQQVLLCALEWSIPSYLTGHWTQENAEYIIQFIKGAKEYWNIDMDYISPGKNESKISTDWLLHTFKPSLDKAGLSHIKILAPDNLNYYWEIVDELDTIPELENIVDAVGYHYIYKHLPDMNHEDFAATDIAKKLDASLWASEDWSMHDGSWENAHVLAGILNKMYIRDRITAMQIWCPFDGYYNNVGEWSSTGLMKADEPWSGNYEVSPAIWAAAHFTQFVQPGWSYVDNASAYFNTPSGGNYTTLVNKNRDDFSTIVYTDSTAQTLKITLPKKLKKEIIHVWKSNADEQFIHVDALKPQQGELSFSFEPNSIYSITNTIGQQKGTVDNIPNNKAFPIPYEENFNVATANKSPRYFADIHGAFETQEEGYLEQQILVEPIDWTFADFFKPLGPLTQIGDIDWEDYSASVNVQSIDHGFAQLFVRMTKIEGYTSGYSLKLYHNGYYEFLLDNRLILASGKIGTQNDWNKLKIKCEGKNISCYINDRLVKTVYNKYASKGMVGLGSGWNKARFDNLEISKN